MNNLTNTLGQSLAELKTITRLHDLDQLKAKYIGKSGLITAFMQELKNLAPEHRKAFGVEVNQVKNTFEQALTEHKEYLICKELNHKLKSETIDVTLSGRGNPVGSLHPVSLSLKRMLEIFKQLGFAVADGPEVETDYYNFKALNIPDNHPARTMQDTFYTEKNQVLRTHTSPVQIRYGEANTPPIKIVAPGRVYRVDMDATHSPMFHQLEGLWIDENISFANLKGTMIQFLRSFFEDENLPVKFRASFFPFTEPSVEIDIMAKNGKWLEVAGCGMVHPNVLHSMNIDPEKYSGFAFGIGIDRFTMLRYQINDLRLLFENDLDFLRQFRGEVL